MRTVAKRDHNEPEIVKALRACGVFVSLISERDVPDLLCVTPQKEAPVFVVKNVDEAMEVARLGLPMFTIEVKNPEHKGKLKPGQTNWHDRAKADVRTT